MKKTILFFASASVFLLGCTESETNSDIFFEPAMCFTASSFMSPTVMNVATFTSSSSEDVTITINVIPEAMRFDLNSFTVKAGQKVTINFINADSQQHNFVLGGIGSLYKIGEAADALAMSGKGPEAEYIPNSPDIIKASPLLDSEGEFAITFTVPAKPGEYPYMCTFPGHWRIMNGMMIVVAG